MSTNEIKKIDGSKIKDDDKAFVEKNRPRQ